MNGSIANPRITPHARVQDWFAVRGWKPFAFQRRTWSAYLQGRSGLVHAPTGTGKTQAVWLGPVMQWLREQPRNPAKWPTPPPPIQVLWLTPLRALTSDTVQSLREPIEAMRLPWSIEARTGDVSATVKKKQRTRLPSALVTTPESLSLLLSYPESAELFRTLRCVVVDEWHELMSTKRGTQAELGIARLRQWNLAVQVWGMSATMGNLQQAMAVLMGSASSPQEGVLIHGRMSKKVAVESILPADIECFPWSGHLGIRMLEGVLQQIEQAGTTLLFTNTRSQSEIWFNAITHARPDWLGRVALHHGSIDRDIRQRVERMTQEGRLRCVVCTSSLDLGVDFTPVDQVIQIGSPKGIARLMQRAGRSGHAPGKVSKVVCVPTHAWELIEFSAARQAVKAAKKQGVESRLPVRLALDVLVQHVVSVALAGSFDPEALYEEVRSAHGFAELTRQQWSWVLDFVARGGPALKAYPDYAKVKQVEGRYQLASPRLGRLHRMTIGTITSDAALDVRFTSGKRLGSVEEGFVGWLKPGDKFVFAGRMLQLVAVRDMTVWVRTTTGRKAAVPRWYGGRSPLSTKLAAAVRQRLQAAAEGKLDDREMKRMAPLLEMQRTLSRIPREDELLIETTRSRDGHHAFVYPFEGRLVNEGLGALLAHRLAARAPVSLTITANDYGIELLCANPLALCEEDWRQLLGADRLIEDLLACVNGGALARRQFRDIARIAGLIFPGYPGQKKPTRHLQASSELFYDVFSEFDPDNLLLDQARREVLERQLEVSRLRDALRRLATQTIRIVPTEQLTPLSFPLYAERLREQHVTSEKWEDRVRRMVAQLESKTKLPTDADKSKER